MIRSIRLTNWRAYESLELQLERPVTFFVAPNGIGKSSLVEAVRWCLLGTPQDRSRGRAVRSGKDAASVELEVSLPSSVELTIRRDLKRSGAVTFSATADGERLDEAHYHRLLAEAWTADLGLIDALAFGPQLTGKATGFPLRDHLADLLGVTPILRAAEDIKVRRAAIADRIKTLRADLSGTDEAIAAAEELVRTTEAEVAVARSEREESAKALAVAEALSDAASAWTLYRAEAKEYQSQLRSLVEDVSKTLAVDGIEALENAARDANEALDAGVKAGVDARVRAASSASAAELLSTASDLCPTCLRPLTVAERARALESHDQTQSHLHDEVAARDQDAIALRSRLAQIDQFSRTFIALRAPREPVVPDPGAQDESAAATATQRVADASERLGVLSERLAAVNQDLLSLRRAAQDHLELVAAEQEDVVLSIAQRSLSAVATTYMTDKVGPLTTEIASRWKLVFGAEGLRLSTDGVLTLAHGEVDLELAEFSGGERSTALVVTRLLLAASATSLSTMWFDEPLEHLDPRRRAAIAQTIVRAAQLGAIGQVVVTTYEEEIARRLENTAPHHVQLTYARKLHANP